MKYFINTKPGAIFKFILFMLVMTTVFVMTKTTNAQLANSPWPTFHGNLQRTGLSTYDTSHVDGTIKWKFDMGVGTESSPTIGPDGTVYIGANDGYVYAVKEGALIWKTRIGTPQTKAYGGHVSYTSIASTPAIDTQGNIYITSRDQYLFALDFKGKEKWRFPINLTPDNWSSPAIGSDGTIYINGSPPDENFYEGDSTIYFRNNPPEGGLYAINPDGTEKWHYTVKQRMFNSPAIGKDGTLYIAVSTDFNVTKVIAINPDGTEKWNVETPLEIESTPSIADDGTIYAGSFSQKGTSAGLYAINQGGIKWHHTVGGKEVMSAPAISVDGTIYFGASLGMFYAVNPDGTRKWSFDPRGTVESSPAISADGTIYFATNPDEGVRTNFYALNPDGTEKWSYAPELFASSPSSPAIGADGTVYVSGWEGILYAFGGSSTNNVPEQVKTFEESGICPLSQNQAYKHTGSHTVYYITENCKKRPFANSSIFFTYFDSWGAVYTTSKARLSAVTDDTLGFMPYGPKYDPRYGALVKTVSDPKVYLLLGGNKYWITSPTVFMALGYSWDWIEDVDVGLLDKYIEGSEITDTTRHPDYTLIKYTDRPEVYRLENGKKRHIANEAAFNKLNFRWDRIVTIDDTETYPDGEELK